MIHKDPRVPAWQSRFAVGWRHWKPYTGPLCAAPCTPAAMHMAVVDSTSCHVPQGDCCPRMTGIPCCAVASIEAVHWRNVRTSKVQQPQQQQAVQRRGAGPTCPSGPRCPGAGARHGRPRWGCPSPAAALHPCTREQTRAAPLPRLRPVHRQAVGSRLLHAADGGRARHFPAEPLRKHWGQACKRDKLSLHP